MYVLNFIYKKKSSRHKSRAGVHAALNFSSRSVSSYPRRMTYQIANREEIKGSNFQVDRTREKYSKSVLSKIDKHFEAPGI
jgi:hypothetical protein